MDEEASEVFFFFWVSLRFSGAGVFGACRDQRCDHQSLAQVQTSSLFLLETQKIHAAGIKAKYYKQES